LKLLHLVSKEISEQLVGRRVERAAAFGSDVLLDFGLRRKRFLLLSASRRFARIHLTHVGSETWQKSTRNADAAHFELALRKHISGLRLISVECAKNDRIVYLRFSSENGNRLFTVVGQFTGRSSNIFLVDSAGVAIAAVRDQNRPGLIGLEYTPPKRIEETFVDDSLRLSLDGTNTVEVSAALDAYFKQRLEEEEFNRLAASARSAVKSKIRKIERLAENLSSDLKRHGDAREWKKFGDLLLAAATSARRTPTGFIVTDYFDSNLPEIEIPADEGDSTTQAAEKYFRRYSKARNASRVLTEKILEVEAKIKLLNAEAEKVEAAIAAGDRDLLLPKPEKSARVEQEKKASKAAKAAAAGCRRFVSSDGFELLVGKKDSDNDILTFRIAASRDIWLHAADYPGSHTIIRRAGKAEIPHRTLTEAARLAAFYSKARRQTKVAVHYTERKYVQKRKGLPPGQVVLSDFRTILVEPGITVEALR